MNEKKKQKGVCLINEKSYSIFLHMYDSFYIAQNQDAFKMIFKIKYVLRETTELLR